MRPAAGDGVAARIGQRARRIERFAPGNDRRRLRFGRSRTVGVLRILLPATAFGLVVALFAWPVLERMLDPVQPPSQQPIEFADDGRPSAALAAWLAEMEASGEDREAMRGALSPTGGLPGEVRIVSPRYFSRDGSGNPFSVEAELAYQSADGTGLVVLDRPHAEVSLRNDGLLRVDAQRGVYDHGSSSLLIDGGVELVGDDGTRLRTDAAYVRFEEGRAWSQTPVAADGPFGRLNAEGFLVTDQGRTVIFTGRSTLILNPATEAGETPRPEGEP